MQSSAYTWGRADVKKAGAENVTNLPKNVLECAEERSRMCPKNVLECCQYVKQSIVKGPAGQPARFCEPHVYTHRHPHVHAYARTHTLTLTHAHTSTHARTHTRLRSGCAYRLWRRGSSLRTCLLISTHLYPHIYTNARKYVPHVSEKVKLQMSTHMPARMSVHMSTHTSAGLCRKTKKDLTNMLP